MSLYESIASRLVGTPLQRPAEWLRWLKGARSRREHPELGELYVEDGRLDEVMRRTIGPSTNCIDVGCHLGTYLHKIVTLAPRGTHRAFEPVAHKAEWLRRKFPSVTVMQMALGESTGTAEYFVYENQTAYSGLAKSKEPGVAPEARQIECRQLDEVVPADAKIGFIKVDTNGGELGVLRGGRRVLLQDRPIVLLGCTQGGLTDYGLDSARVHSFLVDEMGYRIYLPKDHLAGGAAPLSAARFHETMQYPFQAFNYVVVPEGRS